MTTLYLLDIMLKKVMSTNNPKIEIRDLRSGDWLWTHKTVLFSPYISASDFKVYSGLASYAGNLDQKSWPSLLTLATKLHIGKSTVIRSLKILEACKLIQIDRRDGTSNLYSLLHFDDVEAPTAPKKTQSSHHRMIKFFHETTQKTRKITPVWNPRDTAHLKRVLEMAILSEDQLEQLMLYFLASPQFKKFTPSMATFFSAGIFNGLQNTMKNDPNFWKDLDSFSASINSSTLFEVKRSHIPERSMSEMIEQLSKKMSLNKKTEHVAA